ncbi:phage tail tape measure C-terminal domain-containing protein [Asticcacaulis sp.]|uniref:phage tail tape measure C-terminal domain-containing protein n=1 Tax=Asticcacaulis sp. TaxID=1872648 RepID=UPI002BD14967|nr:phage tail tape measure C-terminal domain-containing protein [Asticcacaulis sp.]HTM79687.1 phage tail tape measure C-terminal domain-containing protein [Asticcacaulis sp.]
MSDPFSGGGLTGQASESAAALKALDAAAADSAEAIDQAFSKAGDSLSRSLARAASDGKVSLKELASAVLAAVNSATGVSSSSGGLSDVLSQAFSAATSSFSGARAEGGFVGAGGSYLVGERGPEMFRPAVSGNVEPGGSSPNVNVTVMVSGGAQALVRSEAQVATALQRAARMGGR